MWNELVSQKQLYRISRNNFKKAVLQGLRILDRPTQGEDDLWTYTSDQMLPSVKLAILLFRERYSIHEAELRITIHASLDKDAMIAPEFRFHVRIPIPLQCILICDRSQCTLWFKCSNCLLYQRGLQLYRLEKLARVPMPQSKRWNGWGKTATFLQDHWYRATYMQ